MTRRPISWWSALDSTESSPSITGATPTHTRERSFLSVNSSNLQSSFLDASSIDQQSGSTNPLIAISPIKQPIRSLKRSTRRRSDSGEWHWYDGKARARNEPCGCATLVPFVSRDRAYGLYRVKQADCNCGFGTKCKTKVRSPPKVHLEQFSKSHDACAKDKSIDRPTLQRKIANLIIYTICLSALMTQLQGIRTLSTI